jgi:hypothetical protein
MALIKCKECGKEVSDSAGKCPQCGAKVNKPIGKLGWAMVIITTVIVVQCSLSMPSSTPSAKPAVDPIAEARFQKTAVMANALKKALREPESVVWETILANDDASVICFEYRARNGFGGMAKEFTVFADNKASQDANVWNKHCTKTFNNMMDVKYAIK